MSDKHYSGRHWKINGQEVTIFGICAYYKKERIYFRGASSRTPSLRLERALTLTIATHVLTLDRRATEPEVAQITIGALYGAILGREGILAPRLFGAAETESRIMLLTRRFGGASKLLVITATTEQIGIRYEGENGQQLRLPRGGG